MGERVLRDTVLKSAPEVGASNIPTPPSARKIAEETEGVEAGAAPRSRPRVWEEAYKPSAPPAAECFIKDPTKLVS